ncbi:GNAT family N-acetyltransferase [Rhodococcus sp. A5(2022)]|uniref:GNAT family N-acetyltransferase n=1 Tax=Rhodococcus sp. A5(2022) TaxID=3003588 RepID=UPI0022A85371|nr:GNAT family N-acetyltransferase [Rhodococcus sp. A5(2022)]MCZ1071646.1 GNAT family N-acetyltransferase [Rhodococcus sp. A5(2022)]
MDGHLLDIVRLAWCRELGLDDAALATPGRVTRVDDASALVRVLRLGDVSAVVGPGWVVDAVATVPDAELDASALLDLTRGHAVRSHALSYCADWVDATRVRDPLISHEVDDLAELLRRCPPDDVTEAGLEIVTEAGLEIVTEAGLEIVTEAGLENVTEAGLENVTGEASSFVLLDDDHRPLSGAVYTEVQSILADVTALTVPEHRRIGLAATVATLATHDALDAGLVPQWRARRDNTAGRGLAAVLGYTELGTHISVAVPAAAGT